MFAAKNAQRKMQEPKLEVHVERRGRRGDDEHAERAGRLGRASGRRGAEAEQQHRSNVPRDVDSAPAGEWGFGGCLVPQTWNVRSRLY